MKTPQPAMNWLKYTNMSHFTKIVYFKHFKNEISVLLTLRYSARGPHSPHKRKYLGGPTKQHPGFDLFCLSNYCFFFFCFSSFLHCSVNQLTLRKNWKMSPTTWSLWKPRLRRYSEGWEGLSSGLVWLYITNKLQSMKHTKHVHSLLLGFKSSTEGLISAFSFI